MRAWIELDEQGSAWRQTRMLVAWLAHAGYVAQVLIGPEPKILAVSGRSLAPVELEEFGRPPGHNGLGERAADPDPAGRAR